MRTRGYGNLGSGVRDRVVGHVDEFATAVVKDSDVVGKETGVPISTPSPTHNEVSEGLKVQTVLEVTPGPILGSREDAFNLYYPAVATPGGSRLTPPSYNTPPITRPRTPLFISFTRNSDLLVQNLLSYIHAGWPASDIIVIDNSGTMDANPLGHLSTSNPFFLNYTLLRDRLGVSILQTPTLFSFSQLMNFYLRIARARSWETFFWAHMDTVVMSDESASPYKSFYQNVLDILEGTVSGALRGAPENKTIILPWAIRYFNYDYLTLVNVEAWKQIGQWDTFIPYYTSDCDAYSRMYMSGLESRDRVKVSAGRIFDLGDIVSDFEAKLFGSSNSSSGNSDLHSPLNSPEYKTLMWELEKLERFKNSDQAVHRNSWQGQKKGGVQDPWTYDKEGFERMWWSTAASGQRLFEMKWGSRICDLDTLPDWGLHKLWQPKEPEKQAG